LQLSQAQNSADPKRIAFCITELDPGGAERNLLQLAKRLDRANWEPHVYSLQPGGALISDFETAGIPVTSLQASKRNPLGIVNQLTRELKQFQPHILQSFLYHANIVGRIAARRACVPIVVSGVRVAEKRSKRRLWLDWLTDRLVTHHVCVSAAVAQFMIDQAGLPAEKVTTIPNGVDAACFAEAKPVDLSQFSIPKNSTTLLFVGRLDPQKAPLNLMQACEPVLSRQKQVHLLLVGDGPLKPDIESWIEQHSLVNRIHLTGWRDDVAGIYKAAHCLVLPSLWEGMPNVVLEAMAAGLPVVATNVEGCNELIQDHQTGLLVPPDDISALSEAISAMLQNPNRASEYAQSSQVIVFKYFTQNIMAQKYIELYEKLQAAQRS